MTYLKAPVAGDTAPGIHILLVSVTEYFHLPGGNKRQFAYGQGFQVLDAPDHSCKALGDWFYQGKLAHPTLPIKSIDMIASKVKLQGAAIEKPTFANVSRAINRWHDLGELSEDNLLIFYFCGHGLMDGVTTHSLLCADFGANNNGPFDHAVYYEGLERGMRANRAKKQVFMLDICRRTDTEITNRFRGPGGDVIGRLPPADITDVSQSVIWATSGGAQAWSRDKSPSVFAQAFIKAFDGGAATDDPTMPGVFASVASIRTATAAWIKALGQAAQEPQVSQPTGREFPLHRFTNVKIPVFVRCDPQNRTNGANLSCWEQGRRLRSSKAGRPFDFWHIDLPHGTYTFKASHPLGNGQISKLVHPPLSPIFIRL